MKILCSLIAHLQRKMDNFQRMSREELLEKVVQQSKKIKTCENLVDKLRLEVRCPVCLSVPIEGPVPSCPRGHTVCYPCWMKLKGNKDCPSCRAPMGSGRNLLAQVVIENLDHRCSLEGCNKLVAHDKYKKHLEECEFRLVTCPGADLCGKAIPYNQLHLHARSCAAIHWLEEELFWRVEEKFFIAADMDWGQLCSCTWPPQSFLKEGKLFFVNVRKEGEYVYVETLMRGTPTECARFTSEVTIFNQSTGSVACKFSSHPSPVREMKEVGTEGGFAVPAKSVASVQELVDNRNGKRFIGIRVNIQQA